MVICVVLEHCRSFKTPRNAIITLHHKQQVLLAAILTLLVAPLVTETEVCRMLGGFCRSPVVSRDQMLFPMMADSSMGWNGASLRSILHSSRWHKCRFPPTMQNIKPEGEDNEEVWRPTWVEIVKVVSNIWPTSQLFRHFETCLSVVNCVFLRCTRLNWVIGDHFQVAWWKFNVPVSKMRSDWNRWPGG